MSEYKYIVIRETPNVIRHIGIFDTWSIARCVRKHCQRRCKRTFPKDKFYVVSIIYQRMDALFLRIADGEMPF